MHENNPELGFAITGSFCTFHKVLPMMEELIGHGFSLQPILSYASLETDTRFGEAKTFKENVERLCQKTCITTIKDAEPIGPKAPFLALLIAPCTGNTLAKLANGITDTPVLMAAKAQLRNQRPVILFLSSNDALGMNLKNIGLLLNSKNIYFVPFGQDDFAKKPNSLISHPHLVTDTIMMSLLGKQLQPLLVPFSS